MNNTITYALIIEDDRFELNSHITIGRHLDNDLVVAGEDVLDFHARIELNERGPWLVRLNDAPLHVNKLSVEDGIGLVPEDEIIFGQHTLTLKVTNAGAAIKYWKLVSRGGSSSIRLSENVLVGRSADCDLCISEGFVSRRHAQLSIRSGLVWIRDLESSNGTFVNGKRIIGAVLMLHGDEIAFDTSSFQLVGEAEHLTPVIEYEGQYADSILIDSEQTETSLSEPEETVVATLSTVEVAPVILDGKSDLANSSIHKNAWSSLESSALIGLSEPVLNEVFPLLLGRHLIGRDPDSDIQLYENSVSGKHAELDVRIDGVYLTNLIATNGTLVNGDQVQSQRIQDGDIVDLGMVRLVFRESLSKNKNTETAFMTSWPLVAGSILLLGGLLLYLFL